MNFLLHPRTTYREMKKKQKNKCFVNIEKPKMKIKGRTYRNDALNFPHRYDEYIAFLGIPYAVPPIGPRRFQPPESLPQPTPPPFRKSKTIKAYHSFHPCLQLSSAGEFIGSEDCLYLNIYMPKKPEEIPELLPVLVYIHGGAFTHGHSSTDVIQPDNLLQHDLIFITINYRLGQLGFLNMGTDTCRGNVGLKDQVKALQWIQDNIAKFKGDPSNVTIFGHDFGATCVNLHLFSPLSRGLFHRSILMSGNMFCPWGLRSHKNEQKVKQFFMGIREVAATTLKLVQPKDVIQLTDKIIVTTMRHTRPKCQPTGLKGVFGPSAEYISDDGAFLPSEPCLERLMKEATPVSTIAGIAEMEGYKYFSDENRRDWIFTTYKDLIQDIGKFTTFLQENFCWSEETAKKRRCELRTMYFGDEVTLKWMDFQGICTRLATFLTDLWFCRLYDTVKIGQERSASERLYLYQYDYRPIGNQQRRLGSFLLYQDGPGHGEEIQNMFDLNHVIKQSSTANPLPTDTDRVVGNMCSMWANFCKDGNPKSDYEEIEWTPHTEENPSYLSIGRELTVKQGQLKGNRWPRLRDILLSELGAESTAEIMPETTSFEN